MVKPNLTLTITIPPSRPPFSWEILLARREQRKRYVYLYADWLRHAARGGRKPSEAERAERADLERQIPRDIYAERGLVRARARVRDPERCAC